jgi:hypothetical protein
LRPAPRPQLVHRQRCRRLQFELGQFLLLVGLLVVERFLFG